MKPQQYLPLYMGQPCQWSDRRNGATAIGKLIEIGKSHVSIETSDLISECTFGECKLILRQPASITKKEWDRFHAIASPIRDISYTAIDPSKILYLFSLGIDLFGLIRNNAAIDRADFPDTDSLGTIEEWASIPIDDPKKLYADLLFEQYQKRKAKDPDTILLFETEGLFTTFNDDAAIVGKICKINIMNYTSTASINTTSWA